MCRYNVSNDLILSSNGMISLSDFMTDTTDKKLFLHLEAFKCYEIFVL